MKILDFSPSPSLFLFLFLSFPSSASPDSMRYCMHSIYLRTLKMVEWIGGGYSDILHVLIVDFVGIAMWLE